MVPTREIEDKLASGFFPDFFCTHVGTLLKAKKGGVIFWEQVMRIMDEHIELLSRYETSDNH